MLYYATFQRLSRSASNSALDAEELLCWIEEGEKFP